MLSKVFIYYCILLFILLLMNTSHGQNVSQRNIESKKIPLSVILDILTNYDIEDYDDYEVNFNNSTLNLLLDRLNDIQLPKINSNSNVILWLESNALITTKHLNNKIQLTSLTKNNDLNDFPNEVPKCAEQYCTDVPNYPKESLLRALKKENLILHNDHIVNADANSRTGHPELENDVPLCEASEYLIYPKTAQSIYNEWYFIVNEGSYTQSIKVETCKKENVACNLIEDLKLGYETYCKQKYFVRELVTFNKTGQFGKSSFKFPSNCCCTARMDFFAPYRIDPSLSKKQTES